MTDRPQPLPVLMEAGGDRAGRDRLELLTALINGPSFDPLYRADVIRIPRDHPVYRWGCVVGDCGRARTGGTDLCEEHRQNWCAARGGGVGKAAFVSAACGLDRFQWAEQVACRVCPQRPAVHISSRLCGRHFGRWRDCRGAAIGDDDASFHRWLAGQEQFDGYGTCRGAVCPDLADSPMGLCSRHEDRYRRQGRPGGARLPKSWSVRYEQHGLPVEVSYDDRGRFWDWCAQASAVNWPGQVNLRGLQPLVRAEIQWTLGVHAGQDRNRKWEPRQLQQLAHHCRDRGLHSLADLDPADIPSCYAGIVRVMLHLLRLVYFTPADTREAGFIETGHFGVRFPGRASHIDVTEVTQRWLRDLLWDHLAELMRSARRPRCGGPVDYLRRACIELSAFLAADAPGGGHDPAALRAEHAQRFVSDQQHRARHGLASQGVKGPGGAPSTVTANTCCLVVNGVRRILRDAMDSGVAERLGLGREFITAIPAARHQRSRARRPFPDEVARALADDANLGRLAAGYDPEDQGMRDIWETIVCTGRRVSEVIKARLDCIGRYGGLPMFWHDQAKVGNLDVAIRIPERLHQILTERQRKTVDRFTARHGRAPAGAERAALALFPSKICNLHGTASLTYTWFWEGFRSWVDALDVGHYVAHQARHTIATNLLRNGATLTHVRRYLGHVSDRMAEHYVHLTSSDLDDVLHRVWVAGPGAADPGKLLTSGTTPMTAGQAQALAVDLSRRSTPAEGGFCTFQPVVDGGACPWNLNCHSCDKFVMSGADLLYWRRKREQWNSIAERAPDDATADYLHQVFAPTAAAIDGLEGALAGLGLLDQALALDLRRPQDYFQRIWSLGFRVADLTGTSDGASAGGDSDRPGVMPDAAGTGDAERLEATG